MNIFAGDFNSCIKGFSESYLWNFELSFKLSFSQETTFWYDHLLLLQSKLNEQNPTGREGFALN